MKKAVLLILALLILLNHSFSFGYSSSFAENIQRSYYPNGSIKTVTVFHNGKPENIKMYYENGFLKSEGNFKNDKLDGKVKSYYENNGRLERVINMKNGKQDGPTQIYDEDGNLTITILFKDNKLISGKCGSNGRMLSSKEIDNYKENGETPDCP